MKDDLPRMFDTISGFHFSSNMRKPAHLLVSIVKLDHVNAGVGSVVGIC